MTGLHRSAAVDRATDLRIAPIADQPAAADGPRKIGPRADEQLAAALDRRRNVDRLDRACIDPAAALTAAVSCGCGAKPGAALISPPPLTASAGTRGAWISNAKAIEMAGSAGCRCRSSGSRARRHGMW